MTRIAVAALAAVGTAGIAACGVLNPYPTYPRTAQTGQPAGERVAICYNTLTTTLAEVRNEAQGECAPDTAAEPVDTDWYLQTCPLLLPSRATFVCMPRK